MKITRFDSKKFKELGACSPGLDAFTAVHPDGMDITLENLKNSHSLQWAWVGDKFISAARKQLFLRSLVRQQQEHEVARERHIAVCRTNGGVAPSETLAAIQALEGDRKYHVVNALFEACQADIDD